MRGKVGNGTEVDELAALADVVERPLWRVNSGGDVGVSIEVVKSTLVREAESSVVDDEGVSVWCSVGVELVADSSEARLSLASDKM